VRLYPRRFVPPRALIVALAALALASPALAADPRRDDQWGLRMVEGPAAWKTSTGVGAVVAVIDTGVQRDHPDLGGRLRAGFDYVGDDPEASGDEDADPTDGNGHGTHVTGIVAANRDNGEGIAGVAPGADVLPVRVLDDEGAGYAEDTIDAIHRAIDAHVHVINLSLGDYLPLQSTLFPDEEYKAAIKRAVDADIVVVLAAGNNGFFKCENPVVDGMLCVGAVGPDRTRSVFSSFGADVDLMAPGGAGAGAEEDDILSTWLKGRYEYVSGTSQAAPHVAGVAALLASLGVRGQAAVDRIVATASDAGAPGPDNQYGAGIVDAAAAVAGLGPGDPGPAHGSYSLKKKMRVRAVKKRGFRVKCVAARAGTCRVAAFRRGERIARGRKDVPASTATVVRAPLNRAGRRLVDGLEQRVRVRVRVTLPGESPRARRVTVRP